MAPSSEGLLLVFLCSKGHLQVAVFLPQTGGLVFYFLFVLSANPLYTLNQGFRLPNVDNLCNIQETRKQNYDVRGQNGYFDGVLAFSGSY